MPRNTILADALLDSELPPSVKRALQAKAAEIKADKKVPDREAARMAIEDFHGITKEDLETTLDALRDLKAPPSTEGGDSDDKNEEKRRRKEVLTPSVESAAPDVNSQGRRFPFHRPGRGPIEGGIGSRLAGRIS